jgi:hypothetical protein
VKNFFGSVAKIGWGRKKHGPGFSLGGNLEEALHESYLSANAASPDSSNLSFYHHIHRLISTDGPPQRKKASTAKTVAAIEVRYARREKGRRLR